jgi:hypothetical protein
VIAEHAVLSAEQADKLGYAIVRQIANNGLLPAGIRLRTEPLPPWESTSRLLPDESSGPMPWQVEPHPRIEIRLRVARYDIFGNELPREELAARLHEVRRQIAAVLANPFVFHDNYVEGTIDAETELLDSDDERSLELRVGVTLFEL